MRDAQTVHSSLSLVVCVAECHMRVFPLSQADDVGETHRLVPTAVLLVYASGYKPVVREPLAGSHNLTGGSRKNVSNGVFFVFIIYMR
jgi:hypothetical protein